MTAARAFEELRRRSYAKYKLVLLVRVLRCSSAGAIFPCAWRLAHDHDMKDSVAHLPNPHACSDLDGLVPFALADEKAACLDPPPVENTTRSVVPKLLIGAPLVTIRGRNQVAVTFTAALARHHDIPSYSHVAMSYEPKDHSVEFIFGHGALENEGGFRLGFNGGSAKTKGSPSRVFQLPKASAPFLRRGRYLPRVDSESRALRLTVLLDEPVVPDP